MQSPIDSSRAAMFPVLNDACLEKLKLLGCLRTVSEGEIIFDQGCPRWSLFVVLKGKVEVVSPSSEGDILITVHEAGEFTGEVNLLFGRPSLARGRAIADSELIEIAPNTLRRIIQTEAVLSEILLRAFLQRRATLIANSLGGILLIGSRYSADSLRLKEFLARNGHPYTYLDVEGDAAVQDILEHFGVAPSDVPVLICRDLPALRNPSNAEVAQCLGLNTDVDEGKVYDLVVVGAGPSGLAAAVYAASEGLDVLVLEGNAPGGQAGSSSRIENYLGFPTGISGQELAARASVQAEKFGAHIAIARVAASLTSTEQPFRLECTGGPPVWGRSIVIASGAEYRKLPLPNLHQFEGVGVYYGATALEAQLCVDEDIVIIGGGNSAGQAAVFLSGFARHVHIVVRGPGLADSMSRYLIGRIEENPTITLCPYSEVTSLEGNGHLERLSWGNHQTGKVVTQEIRHLFSMAGAVAKTGWLRDCCKRRSKNRPVTAA